MVSIRCKMVVRAELEKLHIDFTLIELGEVTIKGDFPDEQRAQLKTALQKSGFELMDDKKAMLVEKIKNVIVEMVHYSNEPLKTNFSDYLSEKLKQDYTQMSNVFSQTKGITIEHYITLHKIEKVKELLIYDELKLSEIAWKMHYSSVAHLCTQFKRVTGLTPTFFKSLKHRRRTSLENL